MLKKIKSFATKGWNKAKAMFVSAIVAVSAGAMTVAASAADATSSADTTSIMKEAGDQLTSQFSGIVSTVIPVILGILGSGLVIFGIIKLVKLAKKIFGNVAG